jgi:hypothetical protein
MDHESPVSPTLSSLRLAVMRHYLGQQQLLNALGVDDWQMRVDTGRSVAFTVPISVECSNGAAARSDGDFTGPMERRSGLLDWCKASRSRRARAAPYFLAIWWKSEFEIKFIPD